MLEITLAVLIGAVFGTVGAHYTAYRKINTLANEIYRKLLDTIEKT